jgi:hypothetical protein
MLKYGYFLENLFNKLHCDSKKIKPELKINNINWLIKLINVRPLKRFYPIINRESNLYASSLKPNIESIAFTKMEQTHKFSKYGLFHIQINLIIIDFNKIHTFGYVLTIDISL